MTCKNLDTPPLLMIGNFLSGRGGNRAVCEELAERLAAVGWDIRCASTKAGKLPRLADMLRTAWRNRHEYDVAQVDVYSGPAFRWAEASCWTLRRAGKPYVLTLHGGNLPAFADRHPRRTRRLLEGATEVTTPSSYLLERMRPFCSKLRLLPNPLDVSLYEFRQRRQVGSTLVWLRAFHEIYNPSLAAQVVARLAASGGNPRLVMVGPDKQDGSREKFDALAAELGVTASISVSGAVSKSEVPGWLQRGDIFLNTARVDNTPISVMEAMATGLCIVSTEVGGIPYLLEHEHDALLVPDDDVEAMTAAVRRLQTDPGLAQRLSSNARAKAETFDWSQVLPQWERILSQAAKWGMDDIREDDDKRLTQVPHESSCA